MKTAKRRKKTTLFHKIEPVLYLAPAFIVLGIFVYFPFFKTIIESFFLLNSMGEVREFIGFENYINIFSNSKFIQSIFNSIKFAIFTVPFTVGLSFILAMMAAKKRPASPVYETLFSLPMAMSTSVAAMIFELMSKEVTESARLDGANAWQQAVSIVMPLISPTLFFLLCNSLAKMLMMSNLTLILTQGGPQGSTETMISYMYKQTTENANYNNAYASAVIAFLITMVATIITFIYEKKGVNYDS